ncbi:MAG: hypothetical protein AAF213_06230, partial [Pseudomonadota bacterium]
AQSEGIAKPLYKRLQLDEHKLRDNIVGVRDIGKLSDPVGVNLAGKPINLIQWMIFLNHRG